MIDDDDIVEDPGQRPPPFFLELIDEPLHLETLTIETWFHPSIRTITSSLDALSVCIEIKRLALRSVLFRFDSMIWLLRLRFFLCLVSFQFGSDDDFEPEDPLPQGTSLVPLPYLETIEFALVHSVDLVLKALNINVPSPRVLRIERGTGLALSDMSQSLARLEVLELTDPEDDSHNLAKIVQSPCALRSIYYYRHATELQVGLDPLIELARSSPSDVEGEGLSAAGHVKRDGPLFLFLGPPSAQPGGVPEASSSEAKDFVLQLDALGMMRSARERAYGCMFRIQVSPRLVEWWPAVAEVVQRHPDFLELGELRSSNMVWRKR